MKIETKYNIDDIVYYEKYNEVRKAKVVNIRAEWLSFGTFEPIYTIDPDYNSYKLWGRDDKIDLAESKISDSPISLFQKQIDSHNREIDRIKGWIAKLEIDIEKFNKENK